MAETLDNEIALQIMAAKDGQREDDYYVALVMRADAIASGDEVEPLTVTKTYFKKHRQKIASGLLDEADGWKK